MNINNISINGSFFIAAIGIDGIMVASDSRGVIYDTEIGESDILAYYDDVPKIFIVNNIVISEVGNAMFDNYFLHTLFEIFSKEKLYLNSISDIINNFFMFSYKKLKGDSYELLAKNQYVMAGFENGLPFIGHQTKNIIYKPHLQNIGFIQSGNSIFSELYSADKTCEELGKLAEKSIYKFAVDNNVISIGGKISVVKIQKSNITWLKNKPNYSLKDSNDFRNNVLSKNIDVTYTSEVNKKKFEKMFDIK